MTRPEFDTHQLNAQGLERIAAVGEAFSALLDKLDTIGVPANRERALVVTKLQEAKHWAVRALAVYPLNQRTASSEPPDLARKAYEAYCASSDGKNFRGEPCPSWDALPEAIRTHWQAAVVAMVAKL